MNKNTIFYGCSLILLSCLAACGSKKETKAVSQPAIADTMVLIKGGTFTMGSAEVKSFANERPAHQVMLHDFWIDIHEVTNREYAAFVKATGYQTVAERELNWEELKTQLPPGTPKPDAAMLQPGSLVFTPPKQPVPLDDLGNWWTWTIGANWQHPEGPGSDLKGRENHPVVHIAYEDAITYAKWAGKRLPTEAEWEYASRGGLEKQRYTWGSDDPQQKVMLANIWQGHFPDVNTAEDGYARTAPVGVFTPNGYGLYDMAGNVWEWCSDWYNDNAYKMIDANTIAENPEGPYKSFDTNEPYAVKRVTKGGSFLCHVSYCESYRPSARRGTSYDSGMSHIGFRCVKDK